MSAIAYVSTQWGSIIVASEWLMSHIIAREDFRDLAYPDPGYGWQIPTIGFGRTEGVYRGERTNREHEKRWLITKLGYLSDSIIELLDGVTLTSNQLDALIALVYNIGLGSPTSKRGFYRSTLRAKLNAGDLQGAAREFDRWVISNGKRMRGLIERRRIERRHFES